MKKASFGRRRFVQLSALGIGMIGSGRQETEIARSENDSSDRDSARPLNIVCVGAHPGDPEFGCGGTLARYSAAGHQVTLIYLTRGEAGDPTKTFEESAALRTREAENSCKILHAKPVFAGQIDGNTELNRARNESMKNLILDQRPDIVFTHWPLDAHSDHQVAGLLTLRTWIQSGREFHLFFYEVNTGSETMGFEPTDYVDISSVRGQKNQALLAHQTQDPVEVYQHFFRPMEEFRGLEAGVVAAEGFIYFKPKSDRASIYGL
jgi:LmbE family N-acetylglucosaminyl deacetylase